MAIQTEISSLRQMHAELDAAATEARLRAEDQAYLDREVDGIPYETSRRSFLGRASRTAIALGALAAVSSGVAKLTQGQGGLVSTAEGAERAVPILHGQPAPAQVAPRAPAELASTPADRKEWELFRRRFTTADGRVIDTGNDCVSHTEGQGWGMLFAVAFDDPESFDRILGWTTRNLRRRGDALHAWRYVPGAAQPVADLNNATDGDLYIACALWRAAFRWNRPDYAARATAIARDILRLCVRQAGSRTVLLPAAEGFEKADVINVNPSYYCFTALQELSAAVPSPLWDKLCRDGVAMIAEGRFGEVGLPPDWLSVNCRNGALAPAQGWPARFSWDAIRVPLNLAWAGLTPPSVRQAFTSYWPASKAPAAWVDLRTNDRASYPAPPGIVAVAKIATASAKTALPHDFPSIRSSPDYYSAALTLLARLAWHESTLV